MDPISAIGALASAIQLFDISLKYSYRACSFLSALKHSKQDAAVLERTLAEVNSLMRNLQMYTTELQQSSATSSVHPAPLQRSIVQISQQFANDMTALHEVLPRDLSTSMLNRVKFVIRTSETDKVLRRLEQRKSAATLALGIIGRMDDIQLRTGISSLESRLHQISVEQNVAVENHNRLCEAVNSESQERDSEIIAALQELHGMILQNGEDGSQRHDVLTAVHSNVSTVIHLQNDALSSYQKLEAALKSNTHAINLLQETQTAGIATARSNLEAANIDALGRLLRAELRQQLEPVLNNIDGVKEHIDSIVMEIGNKANAECLFGTRQYTPIPSDANHKVDQCFVSERFPPNSPQGSHGRAKSRSSKETRLFSYSFYGTIAGAVSISIRLRTYLLRGQIGVDSQTKFFQLQVDIIPKPWLCARGFSTFYSSGPDHRGYYNICPSITPFGIIPRDVLRPVMVADDVGEFKRMLQRGEFGIRDQDRFGENLFHLSLYGAPSIAQYLLRDTGYGENFVQQDEENGYDSYVSLLMGDFLHRVPLETLTSFLSLYNEFSFDAEISASTISCGWSFFYYGVEFKLGPCTAQAVTPEMVEYARVLARYGLGLQLPSNAASWWQFCFLMNLYIKTGGNPNLPDEFGHPPLLTALWRISRLYGSDGAMIEAGETQGSTMDGGEQEMDEKGTDVDENKADGVSDIDQVELSVKLLSNLISAGADVHHTYELEYDSDDEASYYDDSFYDDGYDHDSYDTHIETVTDLAHELDVEDIWFEALRRCGLDIDEVVMESDRRASEHRKLRGAIRTGVDIEPLVENSSSNELRYRVRRHVEELD